MTIQELKAAIMEMANETKEGVNTAKRIGELFDGVVAELEKRQAVLGFTPENTANKDTTLNNPSNTKYPTSLLLRNQLSYVYTSIEHCSALEAIVDWENPNYPIAAVGGNTYNMFYNIKLTAQDQYRCIDIYQDIEGIHTLLELENTTANVIAVEFFSGQGQALRAPVDTGTYAEIEPGMSVEFSWILVGDEIKFKPSTNCTLVY